MTLLRCTATASHTACPILHTRLPCPLSVMIPTFILSAIHPIRTTAPVSRTSVQLPATIHRNVLPPLRIPPCLLPILPTFDIRDIPIRKGAAQATLPHIFNYLGPVSNALRLLAERHFACTGGDSLKGRIALVRGTPCPRWHVDKVDVRGLVTLIGPGSEVWEGEQVIGLEAGDLVLMMGIGVDGEKVKMGVLHRSPKWDGVRVVVQTDSVEL